MTPSEKPACAICGAAQNTRFRPFCSRRCADIDLNRWFTGRYAVPVVELDEGDLEAIERAVDDSGEESGEDDPEDGEFLH